MENSLYLLIYLSRSSVDFSKTQLVDLCAAAASNNQTVEVTGLLLCIGNKFLQVLEGPKEAVTRLYKKIRKDDRHTQCNILFEGQTSQRLFEQWSMNFLQMKDDYFLQFEEFKEIKEYAERLLSEPDKRKDGIVKLIQKIPHILKSNKIQLDIISPCNADSGKY
ncbi:MAG: BLUF domain-containing protein [Bdellovibrionales bacterium]|nr:BLUF domain-containing protein [Bdellovibrionales bacterium]